MAHRRCLHALGRHWSLLGSLSTTPKLHSSSLNALYSTDLVHLDFPSSTSQDAFQLHFHSLHRIRSETVRFFSSQTKDSDEEEDEDDEEDDEEEDESEEEDNENEQGNRDTSRTKSPEDKEQEAEAIGYKVIGRFDPSERLFKKWEPVFAVVQIGSHQFKVTNGDAIYTEKLKYCDVNDKLILNKVLMLGSKIQSVIGRPILPDAAVHAVVEEHALDAKVIIFKKKRRKNYRRTKGHRQGLTRLRITDIQGAEKTQKAIVTA
ncbi:LOW QUALITY PROTEIN: large ribosomal subunit protein bL21m-like [Aristolochia californica]|uniref:LOW QUALITY PROTEIN: large ribosomal subunit protein bL21m-like n=1 Tax=Aristolochia californica TaxID=171875 RepID=UPI0035DFF98B